MPSSGATYNERLRQTTHVVDVVVVSVYGSSVQHFDLLAEFSLRRKSAHLLLPALSSAAAAAAAAGRKSVMMLLSAYGL